MQRKRTRGYIGDSMELGSRVIPVARIRKVTMSNFMKYVVLLVVIYIVYSVYQKVRPLFIHVKVYIKSISDSLKNDKIMNCIVLNRKLKNLICMIKRWKMGSV